MSIETLPLTIGGATMKVGATYEYLFRSLADRWPDDCRGQFTVTEIDPADGVVHVVWIGEWKNGEADQMFAHGRHPLQHLIGDADSRLVTAVAA
jgi:hypothetical protein